MTTKVDALIRKFDQIMAAGFVRTTAPHIATPQEAVTTLRSGKTVDNKVGLRATEEDEPLPNPSWPLKNPNEKLKTTLETPYETRSPFPERFKESPCAGKQGEKFQKMMDIFKQWNMRKRSPEKILLTEQVSSLIQQIVAPKIKDPGAPTISCIIGDHAIEKALLDLGPDVTIRVDKFYFPVNFIVLDTEPVPDPTKPIPVILGRPFLATANACINCRTGEMKVIFADMKVRLNIFNAFQHPSDTSECFLLDMIEDAVEDTLPHLLMKDPLEACLTHFDFEDFNTEHYVDEVNSLLDTAAAIDVPPWRLPNESLPSTLGIPHIPSPISPPKLELKQLPTTLKYAFLGSNETLPVIIASDLQDAQESNLLEVLKEHKEAIWLECRRFERD
ncbi:uncharacterized protein LOC133876162 [Alnus glutinosa]|uniref:uncharacterized protein LOC133876162 n=1 Tax=Alnus glutinosa TaxID=3517 RepID=UPI002D7819DC|nr:uncharacterized protein LOC133876162 [Alnus glutinosa]